MKRIAIFIDGTWNRPDAENPTNVLRLARCVKHFDRETDTPQYVIYSPGVGAGRGNTRLARRMDRLFGGSLGWGLLDIIEETYRNLVFAYEPGDELYIFGFSRGAFAARSLVGLIRSCGIAPRAHMARIPEALRRYVSRDPKGHPEDPESYLFRADFAPLTATSDSEYTWRRKRGDSEAIRLTIDYLGVWDTVGALGLPGFVPGAARFNAQYRFHDTNLSSSVLAARHAVALDERRATFPPSLWSNLDELNTRRADRPVPAYQQQWFPGDHGSVGGGGSRVGLSSIAMNWIAQGAEKAGLSLNWEDFDRQAPQLDLRERLTNKFGPVGLSGWLLNAMTQDRDGPARLEDLSVVALDRFRTDADYRPAALGAVYHTLFNLSDDAWGEARGRLIARDGGLTHALDGRARPRPIGQIRRARRRG